MMILIKKCSDIKVVIILIGQSGDINWKVLMIMTEKVMIPVYQPDMRNSVTALLNF